jgi:hypothetical protein
MKSSDNVTFRHFFKRHVFTLGESALEVVSQSNRGFYSYKNIASVAIEPNRAWGIVLVGAVLGLGGLFAFPGAMQAEAAGEMIGALLFVGIGFGFGWLFLSTGWGRKNLTIVSDGPRISWHIDGVSPEQQAFIDRLQAKAGGPQR